jgi:hypothetical protein
MVLLNVHKQKPLALRWIDVVNLVSIPFAAVTCPIRIWEMMQLSLTLKVSFKVSNGHFRCIASMAAWWH